MDAMKPEFPDPLSRLLQAWQPEPTGSTRQFVDATIRRLRQERTAPLRERVFAGLNGILREWLPSPGWFLPATASLVCLLAAHYWLEGTQLARTEMALNWRSEVSRPLARISLSGAYVQLTQEKEPR